jgi:hypothetical protein
MEGSDRTVSFLILTGRSREAREECAAEMQRLASLFERQRLANFFYAPHGDEDSYFFRVVSAFARSCDVEIKPAGISGTRSRFTTPGLSKEDGEAFEQRLAVYCRETSIYSCHNLDSIWSEVRNIRAELLMELEFIVLGKGDEMTRYVLQGGTLEERNDFAQAFGMHSRDIFQRDVGKVYHDVPGDYKTVRRVLDFVGKVQTNSTSKRGNWKGLGHTPDEVVRYQNLRSKVGSKGTVTQFATESGTDASVRSYVALVKSTATRWRREQSAKDAVASEALKLEEDEDAEYLKTQWVDPEKHFVQEDARRAAVSTGKTSPTVQGCAGDVMIGKKAPMAYGSVYGATSGGFKPQKYQLTRAEKLELKATEQAAKQRKQQAARAVLAEEEKAAQAVRAEENRKAQAVLTAQKLEKERKQVDKEKLAKARVLANPAAVLEEDSDEDSDEDSEEEDVTEGHPRTATPPPVIGAWVFTPKPGSKVGTEVSPMKSPPTSRTQGRKVQVSFKEESLDSEVFESRSEFIQSMYDNEELLHSRPLAEDSQEGDVDWEDRTDY